jgi:hypothetical protein
MIYNFREYHNPPVDENETDLWLSDSDHIDGSLSLESIITTLQYLKNIYTKNKEIHLTINSCLKGPIMSWIDYQKEYT